MKRILVIALILLASVALAQPSKSPSQIGGNTSINTLYGYVATDKIDTMDWFPIYGWNYMDIKFACAIVDTFGANIHNKLCSLFVDYQAGVYPIVYTLKTDTIDLSTGADSLCNGVYGSYKAGTYSVRYNTDSLSTKGVRQLRARIKTKQKTLQSFLSWYGRAMWLRP